jgi:hypothetical protein
MGERWKDHPPEARGTEGALDEGDVEGAGSDTNGDAHGVDGNLPRKYGGLAGGRSGGNNENDRKIRSRVCPTSKG